MEVLAVVVPGISQDDDDDDESCGLASGLLAECTGAILTALSLE